MFVILTLSLVEGEEPLYFVFAAVCWLFPCPLSVQIFL
jgi:hypothetical protein